MGTFSDSPSRLWKASTISTNAVSTTTRTMIGRRAKTQLSPGYSTTWIATPSAS